MKRVFTVLLLLIVTTCALLLPVLASSGSSSSDVEIDPVTITNYRADLTLDADGLLSARETITADFPALRHGLFRFFDVSDASDPSARLRPTITSIIADGGPIPYELLSEGGGRYVVAKIGDPNYFLRLGEHTFVIDYTVAGALSPGAAGAGEYASSEGDLSAAAPSAFYWNVVAPGWRNEINQADIHLSLPAAASGVGCTAGASTASTTGPCTISGSGTPSVVLGATAIPRESGMTARVTLPLAAPARQSVPWPVSYDEVLGTSVALVALVASLTLLLLIVALAWARSTAEPEPGLPITYAPPTGLSPAQCVYIADENTGKHALVAQLLYLADQGLLTLENRSDDSWLVTCTVTDPEVWNAIDPVSAALASSLGVRSTGQWFLADRSTAAGKALKTASSVIDSSTRAWGIDSGLVARDPRARWGALLWILAIVGAVVGLIGLFLPTMWGLPFAAFVIGGLALVSGRAAQKRTTAGRRVWSEAGGFRRMLSTSSSEERFDFAARRDLFIPYIPYAVAFGVADKWADKYRAEMNAEPPVPGWYPYSIYAGHSLYGSGSGFDSFDRSLNSAIGAYESSQSSSSGGGRSFGGGGGGGGGGSW